MATAVHPVSIKCETAPWWQQLQHYIQHALKRVENGEPAWIPWEYTEPVWQALVERGWSVVTAGSIAGEDKLVFSRATAPAPAPAPAMCVCGQHGLEDPASVACTNTRAYGAQRYAEATAAIADAKAKATALSLRRFGETVRALKFGDMRDDGWTIPNGFSYGDLRAAVARAHASAIVAAGSVAPAGKARAYLAALTAALAPAGVVPGDPRWLVRDELEAVDAFALAGELAGLGYWR